MRERVEAACVSKKGVYTCKMPHMFVRVSKCWGFPALGGFPACCGLLSHSIVFDFILFQFRDLSYWNALPIGGVMVKQTSLGRHILDMGG
jgi:hypothetical protein